MASSKQRSQGGGRTSNSEPRVQLFKEFSGCNFQLSPRDFTLGDEYYDEQSDLQMNYVVIQNNACITDNKTIETRNNIVDIFTAPQGKTFTDACLLVNNELYIGCTDGSLIYGDISTKSLVNEVSLDNKTGDNHYWKSFEYVDDKLVGLTSSNQMWTGNLKDHRLSNARRVPDPASLNFSNLKANGSLKIAREADDAAGISFRINIAYSYVNKYGPTKCSSEFVFYANHPVSEWHSGCYLRIASSAQSGYDIEAAEIYYSTGNASSLLFAGRVDMPSKDGGAWAFDWFGYLDVTSMWPMANLIAPTENLTEGVTASRVACIDSRLYFWGDKERPYRLWIGGNSGNMFSVSQGTGGGFVDVEPGSGQEIRYVDKYKTQSGASIVTMLCDSKNSNKEQRYNLVENSITISNEQSMKSWQAEQVAGAVGCKSYYGAKVCEDGLYSVSRYGLALTTMTMEYNSQIKANYVSDAIKPVFTNKVGQLLSNAILLEVDGVLYCAFGKGDDNIDNILFCYDIDLKSWWTYTLNIDAPIINLIHIDYEGSREGLGIVTEKHVYMLPLTMDDSPEDMVDFETKIQTGELSTTQPQQNWFYLSQMEFRFDYIFGKLKIELIAIDQFGREINTVKEINHTKPDYNVAEWMRVDLRVQSYQIRITGYCRFRMSHFMAKVYTMSSKQGLVWGFDDSQSYRSFGDIHPTFKDYNDIRDAIIP